MAALAIRHYWLKKCWPFIQVKCGTRKCAPGLQNEFGDL
jgi:hypothetical protein